MGCGASSAALVASPLPASIDEFVRAGVRQTLHCHMYLQDARKREVHKPPEQWRVVMEHEVSIDGSVVPIHETVSALADAYAVARALPASADLAHEMAFLRVASFCLSNMELLKAARSLKFLLPMPFTAVPTLLPEMEGRRVARLATVFNRANNSRDGLLDAAEMERLLFNEKASIGDCVFFPLLFRIVIPVRPRRLTAPEFVTTCDRFCTLTSEQLLRLAFFYFATVGTEPGAVPYIAVSTLPRKFVRFRDAAHDWTHPSAQLLHELRALRAAHAHAQNTRAGEARAVAYAALVSAAASAEGGLEEEWDEQPLDAGAVVAAAAAEAPGAVPEEEWGEAVDAARAATAAAVAASRVVDVTDGPHDLVSWHDFSTLARRSPSVFFDLTYLQLQLRRVTLGEPAWARRTQQVQRWAERHGGAYGASAGHHWGYAPSRWATTSGGRDGNALAGAASATRGDQAIYVPPLRVPQLVRFAVRPLNGGVSPAFDSSNPHIDTFTAGVADRGALGAVARAAVGVTAASAPVLPQDAAAPLGELRPAGDTFAEADSRRLGGTRRTDKHNGNDEATATGIAVAARRGSGTGWIQQQRNESLASAGRPVNGQDNSTRSSRANSSVAVASVAALAGRAAAGEPETGLRAKSAGGLEHTAVSGDDLNAAHQTAQRGWFAGSDTDVSAEATRRQHRASLSGADVATLSVQDAITHVIEPLAQDDRREGDGRGRHEMRGQVVGAGRRIIQSGDAASTPGAVARTLTFGFGQAAVAGDSDPCAPNATDDHDASQ